MFSADSWWLLPHGFSGLELQVAWKVLGEWKMSQFEWADEGNEGGEGSDTREQTRMKEGG